MRGWAAPQGAALFQASGKLFSMMYITDWVFEKPELVLNGANRRIDELSQSELFNSPKNAKLLERWLAGLFGVGYERYIDDCEVCVNTSHIREDSDFFLRVGHSTYGFQAVEVQEPERRRADEFKALERGEVKSYPYEPERGRIEGAQWIRDAVKRKIGKRYSNPDLLNLLVYANFSAHQLEAAAVTREICELSPRFNSVWVMTDTHFFSPYSTEDLGILKLWAPFDPG
ncbi:MAG: hypothetical protein JO038_04550 [Alphaproteobacteria bacterium]|nr:hypothetical protein [Alphaproteobacteria bacterium]